MRINKQESAISRLKIKCEGKRKEDYYVSLHVHFLFLFHKLIGQAEKWALQESGVQIILCTCAASGSPRLTSSCDNIQQCIVDECGMCMEPESLVPITSSGARQVVLIGDHKQLQPVIQDQVAKTLGLSVSMFERHSNRAKMLELQYRMVSSMKHCSGIKCKNKLSQQNKTKTTATFTYAKKGRIQ